MNERVLSTRADALLVRGLRLEYVTLGWNVIGSGLVLAAAVVARSVALAGFGLDSLVEIVASLVVVWQLKGSDGRRDRTALRIIGVAFILLAVYIAVQSLVVLLSGFHPHNSPLGIGWLTATAIVMFALAYGKRRTGRELGNRVLETESRVTVIDGYLALAVLVGLLLNAALGWWWADPLSALVIVVYGLKEGWAALHHDPEPSTRPGQG